MILRDKVVIVTGASKGLGFAVAEQCTLEGARVVWAVQTVEGVGPLQSRLNHPGARALVVACDVRRLDELRALVERTVAEFGRIDGLVNNAGVNFVKPVLEVEEGEWDEVMSVDLKGAFFLTQYCARQMVRQRPSGGSIVQIASVHTQASVIGAAPYDAAKHGMVGFSKAAAVELAREGIRVNILSPGLCHTDIWKDIVSAAPSEKACLEHWNANIPGERLIEPAEIAQVTVFLLSEHSRCMTGANVMADLGMTSLLVSREPYSAKRPIS